MEKRKSLSAQPRCMQICELAFCIKFVDSSPGIQYRLKSIPMRQPPCNPEKAHSATTHKALLRPWEQYGFVPVMAHREGATDLQPDFALLGVLLGLKQLLLHQLPMFHNSLPNASEAPVHASNLPTCLHEPLFTHLNNSHRQMLSQDLETGL